MQRRLVSVIAALIFLTLGVFIGLAIEGLWFPQAHAAAAAPAAGRVHTPAGANPPLAAKGETPVTRVVDSVSPSVVTVGAIKRRVVAQPWYDNYFYPSIRYSERFDRIPYMGSGFLVDRDGTIFTNYHVIEDSESLFVTFPDGNEYQAKLVDADKYVDVAVLRLEGDLSKLPAPLAIGDSDALRIGEDVVAFGNPFGNMIEDSRPTVTVGVVSALHRSFQPDVQNQRIYTDMVQTDAAINPGNSGGPLVDITGAVVGMNTFIFSPSGGSTGIGFAIPAARLLSIYQEIKDHGRIRPLLLDFAYQTITSPRLRGVQIQRIIPGGPAEEAGLQLGDIIVEADGRPVTSRETFFVLFASKQVGNRVPLKVWRNGEITATEYHIREAKQ